MQYGKLEKPPPRKNERAGGALIALLCSMPCLGFLLHVLIASIVLLLLPVAMEASSSSSSGNGGNGGVNSTNSTNATNPMPFPPPASPGPSPPPHPPAPPVQPHTVKTGDNCNTHLTELECRTMASHLNYQIIVSSSTSWPPGCWNNPITAGVYYYNTNMSSTGTCQGDMYKHCICGLDNVWNKLGSDIDGEAAYDQSGRSLALSADGKVLAVGAYGNDGPDASTSYAGQIKVYEQSPSGAWTQRGASIYGEDANDRLGFSVAISADGNVLVAGIYKDDTWVGTDSGSVKVYAWDTGTSAWVQRGSTIVGPQAYEFFAWAVDISHDGNTIAVGGYDHDGPTTTKSGHVQIFDWNSGTNAWVQRGADIDGTTDNERTGYGLRLRHDGNTIVVGAPFHGASGTDSGQTRIYDWDSSSGASGAWVMRGNVINGENAGDSSGRSTAISNDGNTVAISGYLNDDKANNAGHVRVFDWDSGTSAWVQRGADIDGEADGDTSGTCLDMDQTGNIVAIGASANDGNGQNSGHVRVYKWDANSGASGEWVQKGEDIDGEAASDASGVDVKMSADGRILAIGAFGNDANGASSGHVRVYKLD